MTNHEVLIKEINNLVAVYHHIKTFEEAQDLLKSIGIATDEYIQHRAESKRKVMSVFNQ